MAESRYTDESTFRTLLDAVPSAILLIDPQGRITYANPTAFAYFGYSTEDFVSLKVEELMPVDFRDRHISLRAKYASNPSIRKMAPDMDLLARRQDGSTFPVEIGLSPLKTENGIFVLATINDLTEFKRAHEHQARLAAMLEGSNYAVIVFKPGGKVITWNPGAERLYGFSADETVDLPIESIMGEQFHAYALEVVARFSDGKGALETETRRRKKDGSSVDVALTSSPAFDEHRRLTAIVELSYDITDRKRAAAELLQRARELARSNENLEHFAYVASHDLQEPLRMITSYLQLLEHRYKGNIDKDADEFIGFAVDGAKRMQSLIADLLNYSRAGRNTELRPVSLEETAKRATAALAARVNESGAVVCYDAPIEVMADRSGLYHLMLNLLSNALKFSGDEPPQVRIEAQREGAFWVVSVTDNGIGINPVHQDRIFGMFERLHARDRYEGNGIGLATCKRIVEAYGGRIWVESEPGKGSSFRFTVQAA